MGSRSRAVTAESDEGEKCGDNGRKEGEWNIQVDANIQRTGKDRLHSKQNQSTNELLELCMALTRKCKHHMDTKPKISEAMLIHASQLPPRPTLLAWLRI